MNQKGPFQQIDSREVYKNKWINVREDNVIRPDGTKGIFGIIEMKGGASVLAMTNDEQIYLTREYKYGIGRDSLELMSGGMDAGENPLQAAQRELREELGLEAREWIDLGFVDPFTTIIKSPNHMFLARGVNKIQWTPDQGEPLEIITIPFTEAIEMVMLGKITHSASCVLILKAARYLEKNKKYE